MKTNSPKAWLMAARPKTLTGAAVPVIVGLSLAARDTHTLATVPALLCLLFAMVMQIDANLVNDYFDWLRGNDDAATRLGPERACAMGWISPKTMTKGIFLTTCIACALGLPLIRYGGWGMLAVGVACVAFCFLYTTIFSYTGLGDMLVLLFFGIVPVCLTYYLQTGETTRAAFALSVACGLAIDNLLMVNNYRDIDNDRRDNKRTLVVRLGRRAAWWLYLLLGLAATAIALPHAKGAVHAVFLVYLLPHCLACRQLRRLDGKELNRVLGMTARNNLLFGIATAIALLA